MYKTVVDILDKVDVGAISQYRSNSGEGQAASSKRWQFVFFDRRHGLHGVRRSSYCTCSDTFIFGGGVSAM